LERLDESLVLLKKYLSDWEYEDLVYLAKNVQQSESESESNDVPTAKIEKWAQQDLLIYKHFNSILNKKIEKYGQRQMFYDAQKLKDLSIQTKAECFTTPVTSIAAMHKTMYWFPQDGSIEIPWVRSDRLGNKTCRNLGRSERKYHVMLQNRDKKAFADEG